MPTHRIPDMGTVRGQLDMLANRVLKPYRKLNQKSKVCGKVASGVLTPGNVVVRTETRAALTTGRCF